MEYLVLACDRCRKHLLAKSGQKVRSCPYCGRKITLASANIVARAQDPEEAREILRAKKERGR